MSKVAITQNENIEKAVEEALSLLDLEPLIKNKIVAVKPNDTWASKYDRTAVTQADTLRAALRFIKKMAPKKIIVTGGAGAGETDKIFRLSGMMDVVEEEEAEFFDHNRPPFETVGLEYAPDKGIDGPQKEVVVNPRVLEYETLVSLAQLKVHYEATVTLSMKNIAMSYPAADYYGHPRSKQLKPHAFYRDMHSFIAGMAKRFPIDIAIIAGHPAMTGEGPIGGHTFETGLVIASTDPVAADAVGAYLLGFQKGEVHHIEEAGTLGVGEADINKLEIIGLDIKRAKEIFEKRMKA